MSLNHGHGIGITYTITPTMVNEFTFGKIWNGIGWALYGFIAGGSGLFAHIGRKKKVTAVPAPDTAMAKPQAA